MAAPSLSNSLVRDPPAARARRALPAAAGRLGDLDRARSPARARRFDPQGPPGTRPPDTTRRGGPRRGASRAWGAVVMRCAGSRRAAAFPWKERNRGGEIVMDHGSARATTAAWTCAFSTILHPLHPHELHRYDLRADLARRKSGVQIPSPPFPMFASQRLRAGFSDHCGTGQAWHVAR
jgi:hypothetical protein